MLPNPDYLMMKIFINKKYFKKKFMKKFGTSKNSNTFAVELSNAKPNSGAIGGGVFVSANNMDSTILIYSGKPA